MLPCPPTPEFDPVRHVYRWQGRVVPGVSSILGAGGHSCQFYPDDPKYRNRGTAIHYACQLLDADELDLDEFYRLDERLPREKRIAGYIDQYREFLSDVKPRWTMTEQAMYSPKLRVAGTLDRAGLVVNSWGIVDIKTGTIPPSVGIQTAGYCCIIYDGEEPPADIRRWVLRLTGTRRYQFRECENRSDYHCFLNAVKIYYQQETALCR